MYQTQDYSHSNTFSVCNASYSECLISADVSRHFHFLTACATQLSTRFPPDNIEPDRLKKEMAENKARKVQRRTISRLLLFVSSRGCDAHLNRKRNLPDRTSTKACVWLTCAPAQLMMQANDHHNLKDKRKQHLKIYQRRMRKGTFSAEGDEATVLIVYSHSRAPLSQIPWILITLYSKKLIHSEYFQYVFWHKDENRIWTLLLYRWKREDQCSRTR